MIDIILDDIKMKQTINNLYKFEKSFVSKKARKAIRNSLKLGKKYISSSVMSMVGGKLGGQIVSSLKIKVPKKRKRNVIKNMITLNDNDVLVYHTEKTVNASGRNAGKSIRYYLPSALEYGHVGPYQGKAAGGPGLPKVARPRPAFRSAAKAARQPMVKSVIEELRGEMKKWNSANM